MSVLVDDLLLLARLDQGRPLARTPVEVRPLVADAVDGVERAVHPQRDSYRSRPRMACSCKVTTEESVRPSHNLLRNAVVHTPRNSPVEVKVVTDGATVRLGIADEGPGLTPEEAGPVFTRFFQADLSRTGQGTGLGLSIVAAIADAHGGRAWVGEREGGRVHLLLRAPGRSRDEFSASWSRTCDRPAAENRAAGRQHAWFGVTG